jgi:predicted alpha/beta hydrolase family esterase
MNQVILIHGMPDKEEYYDDQYPSLSNAQWFPWLQKELCKKDILSQAPEMPRPYEPKYQEWLKTFEQFELSNESIVIGHSYGGGFSLRYFSEKPKIIPKKIILVAPWIDPEEPHLTEDLFLFQIDTELSTKTELIIFYSLDDEECAKSFEIIKEKLPNANYKIFTNKGHFVDSSLGSKTFPELLEEVLK